MKRYFGVLLCGAAVLYVPSAASTGNRIDNGDGTYYKPLPVGESTNTHWRGFVQWQYVGQAQFTWWDTSSVDDDTPVPDPIKITHHDVSEPMDGGSGDIVGTRRIDSLGREWVAINANINAILSFESQYDALNNLGEPFEPFEADMIFFEPGLGDEMIHYPHSSWDNRECWSTDLAVWGGYTPQWFFTPPSDRMDKTVIVTSANGAVHCSGVLIDDSTVLTAAHCLVDDDGNDVEINSVCTRGNYHSGAECAFDISTVPHSKYDPDDTGTSRIRRDIGLVILEDATFGSGSEYGYMALSRASGSKIRSHNAYMSAYPHVIETSTSDCSKNSRSAVDSTLSSAKGWAGHWQSGTAHETQTSIIWTRLDSAGGDSGGPAYYYPSGVSNGAHYVTGVHSGWSKIVGMWGQTKHEGSTYARVKPVRRWIMGLME